MCFFDLFTACSIIAGPFYWANKLWELAKAIHILIPMLIIVTIGKLQSEVTQIGLPSTHACDKDVLTVSIVCCQTPTKSLVKRLGVDCVFTPSQSESQWQSQQPHQNRALAGNLGG